MAQARGQTQNLSLPGGAPPGRQSRQHDLSGLALELVLMSEATPNPGPSGANESTPGVGRRLGALDILTTLCQLFAFATFAIWGALMWPFWWNIVIAISAPALAIVVWALFVSPRALIKLHPFIRAVVELLVYASACIAWWEMGQIWIGIGFAVIAVTLGLLNGLRSLK